MQNRKGYIIRTRDYKQRLEEFDNQYIETKRQEFLDLVINIAESYLDSVDLYEDTISLADFYEDSDMEFEFQNSADWCANELQSELDTIDDQRYQEWKERDI